MVSLVIYRPIGTIQVGNIVTGIKKSILMRGLFNIRSES